MKILRLKKMATSPIKAGFDLSWGDPEITRQALVETLGRNFALSSNPLRTMGYTPHYGNPKLIEQLKNLALRQSGHKPKHLFITCGAVGAINAALYTLKDTSTDWVVTNDHFFPIYPKIIGLTDMIMINKNTKEHLCNKSNGCQERNFISLIDSPSNPEGLVSPFESVDIWDSAYASKTYGNGGHIPIKWKIMAGSLSKTSGLAGLRIGWAACEDDILANSLSNYITAAYIGLPASSMTIAEEVLNALDLDRFEMLSAGYLDSNREEAQKLLTRFGQGSVPTRGMFCILELGKAEKKALERAGIKYQSGETWGEDSSWARLSLGQTREVVRAAVKAALK
jgi:aspartate/methionine/tyrosine aminotransferase